MKMHVPSLAPWGAPAFLGIPLALLFARPSRRASQLLTATGDST